MKNKIMKQRAIVPYEQAHLTHLDAGTCIAYPRGRENGHRYYAVPSFLIIGAAKCGTRELVTWLRKHPNLKAPPHEVNFFEEVMDLEIEWPRYVLSPSFQISKKKEHVLNNKIFTFEKTPAYFWQKNRETPVPALVKKMMPSGKFIAILRNPTDRAYSAYQMDKKGTRINPAWTKKIPEKFEDYLFEEGQLNANKNAIRVGHYAAHLKTWLQYFSKEQLLILTMDEFRSNPFRMMAKVQSFLDIPFFDYSSAAIKMDRGFWVLRGQNSKAYNTPYAPMNPTTRQLLEAYYAPWNEQLKELFPECNFPW